MLFSRMLQVISVLLFLADINFAQHPELTNADLKKVVITMKQEASKGWGTGVNSPYTVTLSGNGTVIFDGLDEGKAISKYEPPVKVVRRYPISEKQLRELVAEFYKIDFFSLDGGYAYRDNGDGTISMIKDGGLATVTTSITVAGKTKSVTNVNFAPEKLIMLQRNIYVAAHVADFVKSPPYWLSKFPNELFPPRRQPDETGKEPVTPAPPLPIKYRQILRRPSPAKREKSLDVYKKWGFIKPCLTSKTGVEKLLGPPIETSEATDLPTYNLKDEKIRVFYSNEKTAAGICGDKTKIDTVILFSVIPIKDVRLSELNIDLAKFKRDERLLGREITYNNPDEGIFIETEIVEFSDKKQAEMVTSIQFSRKNGMR